MTVTVENPEKRIVLSLLFLLGTALLSIGAPDALSQEDPISYTIPYIQSGPTIDGEITEGEWTGAERVYLDNETRPSQNVPALVDTELLMMDVPEDAPLYASVEAIKAQIERMGTITKKLMTITQYKTKDYLKGKIVDLEKASEE